MDKDLITDMLERGAVDFSPEYVQREIPDDVITCWICLEGCRCADKNILQAPVLWARKQNNN